MCGNQDINTIYKTTILHLFTFCNISFSLHIHKQAQAHMHVTHFHLMQCGRWKVTETGGHVTLLTEQVGRWRAVECVFVWASAGVEDMLVGVMSRCLRGGGDGVVAVCSGSASRMPLSLTHLLSISRFLVQTTSLAASRLRLWL